MKTLCFIILMNFSSLYFGESYVSTFNYVDSQYTYNKGLYFVPFGSPDIIHWASHSLKINLNKKGAGDGIPPSDTYSEILEALNEWDNVETSDFSAQLNFTDKVWGNDGVNVIYWCEKGDIAFEEGGPFDENPDAGGITIVKINSNNRIIEADILMNGNKKWVIAGAIYDPRDIQGCITHELGHAIGLGHSDQGIPLPTMSVYNTDDPRSLSEDDIIAISFLYGGQLISDKIVTNTVYFDWTIRIPADKKLILNSGIKVNFNNNSKLIVYGSLNASNTYFRSDGYWGGIYFTSRSSGYLINCTIRRVKAYGGGAITIYQSSPTIKNCYIEHNAGYCNGISILSGSYPLIYNNTIRYNTSHEIYIYNAGPMLVKNKITASSKKGNAAIYCDYRSSPIFGKASPPMAGNNVIIGGYYGILANNSSVVCAGQQDFAHYNQIINSAYANAYAMNYSKIYAVNNWWGNDPPIREKIIAEKGSSVFYYPYLSSVNQSNDQYEIIQQNILINPAEIKSNRNDFSEFSIYRQLIDAENEKSEITMNELGNMLEGYQNHEVYNYLTNKSLEKNSALRAIAYEILIEYNLKNRNFNVVSDLSEVLISEFQNTIHEKNGLMYQFFMNYDSRQLAESKEILHKLNKNFGGEEDVNAARWLLESEGIEETSNISLSDIKKDAEHLDFKLANYPNPFNPMTTITYQLVKDAEVILEIFDITGKQVKTLSAGIQGAGVQKVLWDGKNNGNINVAAGVYICRLKIMTLQERKAFIRSLKLMLLK